MTTHAVSQSPGLPRIACVWVAALVLLFFHPCHADEPVPAETDNFADNIRRVFADDQMADVRVVFGYEDVKDFDDPWDPLRAGNLIAYLLLNGFNDLPVTEEMAEELGVSALAPNLHVLHGPGMPGQTLRVAIMWSAATSQTARNIGVGSNLQMLRSGDALDFLQKAATDAEVQIYLGHSRGGGGPDTFPPIVRLQLGFNRQKVDYSYYRRNRPGLTTSRPFFKKSKETPMIIAWTGCDSRRHFQPWFADQLAGKRHPTSLLLSTRSVYRNPRPLPGYDRDEGIMATIRLIEALRVHSSGDEFQEDLAACEVDAHRKAGKPLWKLLTMPPVILTAP